MQSTDKTLWREREWVAHTQLLLDSFAHWLNRELISREGSVEDQSQQLFEAPFVVVSHGVQDDPILNYGNQVALELWEMDIATLVRTPSRMTAEPLHRDERRRLLDRTSQNGYVDDYRGVRVSSSGQRFLIEQAIVWNLLDSAGRPAGQAATFSSWQRIPSRD